MSRASAWSVCLVVASRLLLAAPAAQSADIEKLTAGLRAVSVEARMAAGRGLLAMGATAAPATAALIDVLKTDDGLVETTTAQSGEREFTYNPVQNLAVQVLAAIGETAIPPLRAAISAADPNDFQIVYLDDALTKMQRPEATSAVCDMLRSDVVMLRRRAADSLVYSHDRAAVNALIAALRDPDAEVRANAAASLQRITGRQLGEDAAKWEAWQKEP